MLAYLSSSTNKTAQVRLEKDTHETQVTTRYLSGCNTKKAQVGLEKVIMKHKLPQDTCNRYSSNNKMSVTYLQYSSRQASGPKNKCMFPNSITWFIFNLQMRKKYDSTGAYSHYVQWMISTCMVI
jgi:hypothetical protein